METQGARPQGRGVRELVGSSQATKVQGFGRGPLCPSTCALCCTGGGQRATRMAPARAWAGGEGLGLQRGSVWLAPTRGALRARRGKPRTRETLDSQAAGGRGRSLGQRVAPLSSRAD